MPASQRHNGPVVDLDALAVEESPVTVTLGGEEFQISRAGTYQAIAATFAGDLEQAMRALFPDPAEYDRFTAHPISLNQFTKLIEAITGFSTLGEAPASPKS